MTFQDGIAAFCDRFLSTRTYELIVAPALADVEFENALGRRGRWANRGAVLRALMGGLSEEMRRGCGSFFKLTLVSVCYYAFPAAMAARFFKSWDDYLIAIAVVMMLALVPVMVCFWPARRPAQSSD
ncbi:MAG TPA: hypothetical protein VEC39_00280 [Vicinamibacterales bacterium]|nr:hypothetical protein [Vicinamibacterales bacterium]